MTFIDIKLMDTVIKNGDTYEDHPIPIISESDLTKLENEGKIPKSGIKITAEYKR